MKKKSNSLTSIFLIIGFVFSLSMGFLDVIISFIWSPIRFSDFLFLFGPLAITTSVFLFLYGILLFGLIKPLARVTKFELLSTTVSLVLFLGSIFVLASLMNLTHPNLSITAVIKYILILLIAVLVSVIAHFVTPLVQRMPRLSFGFKILSLALPIILFETMVAAWLFTYPLKAMVPLAQWVVLFSYILIVLATIGLLFWQALKVNQKIFLGFITLLILLSPFLAMLSKTIMTVSKNHMYRSGHPIQHVILITIDTLRADALSSYNSGSVPTPHIDQLAEDGMLFKRVIAPSSWTLPSLVSIMSGVSPLEHTAVKFNSDVPDAFKSMAQYMREANYYTVAIGFNTFLNRRYFSKGFLDHNYFPKYQQGDPLGLRILTRILPAQFAIDAPTSDLTRLSVNWLQKNRDKEFFLWVHYLDPHAPYAPPAEFLPKENPPPRIGVSFDLFGEILAKEFVPSEEEKKWIWKLYLSEVQYVDANIGKIIKTLKQLNLYDSSLIVITSDHGEEFFEHGGVRHGRNLYNESLQVPLIIKMPDSLRKGSVDQLVPLEALMPTLLNLCQINHASSSFSSRSFASLMGTNLSEYSAQTVISDLSIQNSDAPNSIRSITSEKVKYIKSYPTSTPIPTPEELYDLDRDPKEQTSLTSSFPAEIQQFRTVLDDREKMAADFQVKRGISRPKQLDLTDEALERLKTLGYVQ